MAAAEFRFVHRRVLPVPPETVYAVVGEPSTYPLWWGGVFRRAAGPQGLPQVGDRTAVVARGFLPYRLRFTFTIVAADPPRRLRARLDGDFEGSVEWLLRPAGGGTELVLDFRPDLRKPVVRQLAPLLRPLLVANHLWTIRRGDAALARALGGPDATARGALAGAAAALAWAAAEPLAQRLFRTRWSETGLLGGRLRGTLLHVANGAATGAGLAAGGVRGSREGAVAAPVLMALGWPLMAAIERFHPDAARFGPLLCNGRVFAQELVFHAAFGAAVGAAADA